MTFELSPENLITGAAAAVITTLFFGRFFVRGVKKFFQPARYFWLLIYLFVFIWECLKANFDVAYRVLHPAMPIKPGIVKVKLNLESNIGRTFLAMSITMTPGTIAVDIIDDHIFIHWIFISSTDPEVYSKKISGRFEKHLKRIFE
jgi:multicomponent Na+:H+ antiporter subunit E